MSLLLIFVTSGEAGLLIECLKEVVSVFNVSISERTFSLVWRNYQDRLFLSAESAYVCLISAILTS